MIITVLNAILLVLDSITINAVAQIRAERFIEMIHSAAAEPIIFLP